MTLPTAFVQDLLDLCHLMLSSKKVPRETAEALVGKAGRVAHVLPLARPFVAGLYAALSAARAAGRCNAREAPPGQVACRRFLGPLRLLEAILAFAPDAAVPLHRDVHAMHPQRPDPAQRRIEVDASPWGGGGVLYVRNRPKAWFSVRWETAVFGEHGLTVGESSSQTAFECVVLYLAVLLWAKSSGATLLLGDNTAALQECLALKGRGTLLTVARELAVVRARRHCWLCVAHLLSEAHTTADTLSRLDAPAGQRKLKPGELARVRRVVSPSITELWHSWS